MPKFTEISALPPALLQAVDALGYTDLTEIQQRALPPMLEGRDIVAQAKTGSGKTAAFGLALLALLQPTETRLQVLVLCPTTVLADQHFTTFSRRFRPFPFVVSALSRFQTKAEQREIVEQARARRVTPQRIRPPRLLLTAAWIAP